MKSCPYRQPGNDASLDIQQLIPALLNHITLQVFPRKFQKQLIVR